MSKVIIITGPPGIGKTTISRKFGDKLSKYKQATVFHVEIDNLKHIIIGVKNKSSEIHTDWFALLCKIIEFSLYKADYIIAEGLFYDNNCAEYLLENYEGSKMFLLEAPIERCLYQNTIRSQHDEILDEDEIINLFSLTRPDCCIRIDANQDTDDIVSSIMQYYKN